MSSGCRCVARPGAGGFGLWTCRTENLLRAHEANADTLRCAFRCSGSRQMIALLERPERLKAHVTWIAILLATCLTPVPLRPQDLSPITNAGANSQASNEMILGERLACEYEKQAGLGSTPELVEESARLFALVNFGIADATISFFEAKYIYLFWRPVTPAELTDFDWLPLPTKTAPDPSYPAAHSATSSAAATVLAFISVTNSHSMSHPRSGRENNRHFSSFSAAQRAFGARAALPGPWRWLATIRIKMFKRILAAYDGSHESGRAL
jgi:hypothetical protein